MLFVDSNRISREEGIAEGRAEGIAEGRAEGIAKGRAEGIAEEKKAAVKRSLALGLSPEQVAKIVNMPLSEVEKLK